jgi:hypothetical protein
VKSQVFQDSYTFSRVALIVMQLEYRMLDLAEKANVILNEQ